MVKLFNNYVRISIGKKPPEEDQTHITDSENTLVNLLGDNISYSYNQLAQLRTLALDRNVKYDSYDEISKDSVIAAALELYADDATQRDEQGRIIWVESEDSEIVKAGNRLLDIMEIPERAWKHIYMTCKYGDYYLKLYRKDEDDNENDTLKAKSSHQSVHIINDKIYKQGIPNYEEYIEDVLNPATIFDLKKKGKTAGFAEIPKDVIDSSSNSILVPTGIYNLSSEDINIYSPDKFIHISLSENTTRYNEKCTIQFNGDTSATYVVATGKSILEDVYGIQKELSLLEDTVALTRLVRSPLIRLLEVEVGDMPKTEVNPYLRRFKNLIEQHISLDKTDNDYKSYSAPGPIDNLILVPVKNGKGHVDINTLGGDVNIRDLADLDYFSNKRSAALKIPRSYLGDISDSGSAFENGGTLTRLSIRYARTIQRIQRAYIRAITQLLNLFFIDKGLAYVNKFEVKMTSPSTQEDLERSELVGNNVNLISSIMDLTESLEGDTQKKVLNYLITNVLKMPDIAQIIEEDNTPEEDINIEGGSNFEAPDIDLNVNTPTDNDTVDMTAQFEEPSTNTNASDNQFTDQEYSNFEDEI